MDCIRSLSIDLEAKVTLETRSKLPLVQRYFDLEDKSERTVAENEEMKKLEAEIDDIGLN